MTRLVAVLFLATALFASPAFAQDATSTAADETGPVRDVAIEPVARDEQIDQRITEILNATGWFTETQVRVDDGIVFLDGTANSEDHRVWARDLAAKTQDVVAVVNRIAVEKTADWTFAPALGAVQSVAKRLVASLPLFVLALIVLPLAWWLSSLAANGLRRWLLGGLDSPFLRSVVARAMALPIFLIGLYVVLQVAGLTQIAFSLIGGAGVLGIIFGFAFRDIAENFLASLLLSIRQPFRSGDLIDVEGQLGSVHSMNTRSTVLISPEGNHIQIPNSTVFKSIITNFTAAPEGRDSVTVGVGYDAAINDAQEIIA
ncbi:MAG: mechanosensitive ion channel, partial [Silicimonas sp.]|nr:mechanosensitive ion channel [Silicimonas sp.]